MSETDDCSDDEFAMAIAAAAYAIAAEEDFAPNSKRASKGSGQAVSIKPADPSSYFPSSSFDGAEEDTKSPDSDDNFTQKTTVQKLQDHMANKNTERAINPLPTTRNTLTFTDKYLKDTDRRILDGREEPRTTLRNISTIRSSESDKAREVDDWEKEEIARIKNRSRYEKRSATIQKWEDEKKNKAKYQMGKQERGLEQRQAKAMQEYHDEIAWIAKIASGARTLADEKKRNDECKVREKGQMTRPRRKVLHTCFCF